MNRLAVLIVSIAAHFPSAWGHHSLAEFDRSVQREIEGEVLRVMWSNPHIRFQLQVAGENGAQVLWDLTGLDLNSLDRRSVPHDLVKPGDVIRVAGSPSTRRDRSLYVSNLLTPDGTEIMISPTAEPMWSERIVGRPAGEVAEAAVANAGGASIFRVWSAAAGVRDTRRFSFTAAAIAARAGFDPDDNFAARCEPEGMPRIMTNPHPFEFVDRGDTVALRSELYDLTRTIHMDPSTTPNFIAPTPLGYSVGRWEGKTLVVSTSRVSWPYFDNVGTPQTVEATYVERFTPSDDGERLAYRLTITDPTVFSEPAVYERYWLDLGERIQPYNCQVF